jgi:hypothetical protein
MTKAIAAVRAINAHQLSKRPPTDPRTKTSAKNQSTDEMSPEMMIACSVIVAFHVNALTMPRWEVTLASSSLRQYSLSPASSTMLLEPLCPRGN